MTHFGLAVQISAPKRKTIQILICSKHFETRAQTKRYVICKRSLINKFSIFEFLGFSVHKKSNLVLILKNSLVFSDCSSQNPGKLFCHMNFLQVLNFLSYFENCNSFCLGNFQGNLALLSPNPESVSPQQIEFSRKFLDFQNC
jgi:hypothetical protein